MPPKKRSAGKSTATRPTRAKRPRPSDLQEIAPAEIETSHPTRAEPAPPQGLVSIDVSAISTTISAVVSQALQSALSSDNLTTILRPSSVGTDSHSLVEEAVLNETRVITEDRGSSAGTGGDIAQIDNPDPKPQQVFSSIAVALQSRVTAKLKRKIWANEYVDFGALLFSSPQNEGKYSLSMAPSAGSSNNPQLTLEPCHTTKRIHRIQQWVSAFNIFVSVYTERFQHETPQLMKYCEVVRDMAQKLGDWLWYDEQFRYIRQSDPQSYPWDQIHWELWLRASSTVRKHQPFTNKVHNQTRQRFRQPFYPKGTCWAFQAGKQCSGCQFDHICYKCGAKHPGSQCSIHPTQNRPGGFGSKSKGAGSQISSAQQPASHTSKGGSA